MTRHSLCPGFGSDVSVAALAAFAMVCMLPPPRLGVVAHSNNIKYWVSLCQVFFAVACLFRPLAENDLELVVLLPITSYWESQACAITPSLRDAASQGKHLVHARQALAH